MDNCKLSHAGETMSEVMLNVLQDDASLFSQGTSQIKVYKSTDIHISNTVVSDIHYIATAAFISITEYSAVSISNVTVSGLSAYQGGVFTVTGYSTLTLKLSTFLNNLAVKNGVFAVGDYSNITMSGCTFKGNQAVYQGVFRISGESYFEMNSSIFQANIAENFNSIGQVI